MTYGEVISKATGRGNVLKRVRDVKPKANKTPIKPKGKNPRGRPPKNKQTEDPPAKKKRAKKDVSEKGSSEENPSEKNCRKIYY